MHMETSLLVLVHTASPVMRLAREDLQETVGWDLHEGHPELWRQCNSPELHYLDYQPLELVSEARVENRT